MANRINKVTTKTTTKESPVTVDGKLSYSLYDSDGNKVGTTLVEPGTDMSMSKYNYYKQGEDGTWQMSETPEMNIVLDESTGNIKISAPKSITDSDLFKQFIDEDKLKEYSQAYKLNPEHKLEVQEENEEIGEEETKEITIPEYISRLNSSLSNYASNLRTMQGMHEDLIQKYGDKANNLTDAQIIMSLQGGKGASALYLPDTIFTVGSFGNGVDNFFNSLKEKRGDNGEISAEDFSEVWTRSNVGRDEMAAILATINGTLEQSDWSKDTYYTDADGNQIYSRSSAEEAAKLISFKNYILNNNPEAEWYQQAGDWIESAAVNIGAATTNVFANLVVLGEAGLDLLPGVEAHAVIDWKNEADETVEKYNEISAETWDALTNAQIWGTLAGAALGTAGTSILAGWATEGIKEFAGANVLRARQLAEEAGVIERGSAAWNALTPSTMIALYEGSQATTLGMRLWLGTLNAVTKASVATSAALSAASGAIHMNTLTEYLFDTIHDAILYDGTALRNVIDAVRQNGDDKNKQAVIDYWVGQFAENAKFWLPLGAAKTAVKLAGKTDFGKAANAVVTRTVNKIAAATGNTKQSIKDKLANGSVVKKLEEDIEKALDENKFTKANRLQNKYNQENWNALVRQARANLGNMELSWDGLKLTADSMETYQKLLSDIKVLENGIDSYNRNILNKISEMTTKQYDPSTGRYMYINPELGSANVVATNYYWDLVSLNKKYGLSVAKNSMLNQDVVDYWMNSYYKGLADSFASSDGVNAAKAQVASETLQKNINALSETVPQEIRDYIDNMLSRKVYQSWYHTQNEYGISKGLLNKRRITSYENNPIWQENGYMPIRVQQDVNGHWVENTGRIDAVIEQDFDALTFNVAEGQHYVDPEMVRQSRLRNMAQAEINKELFKAYEGFTHSATNITMVSGSQTEYVDRVNRERASLEKAVTDYSSKAFEENWNFETTLTKRRKPVKNETIDIATRETVVSSMSPAQTTDFLVKKKVLPHSSSKLTDNVTAENYGEWYNNLNDSAKKYLGQQYGDTSFNGGERIKNSKRVLKDAGLDNDIRQWSTFGLEQHKATAAEKILADEKLHNAALNQMYENYLATNPAKPLSFDEFLDSDVELVRWDNIASKQPGEKFYSDVDEYVAFTYPNGPSAKALENSYGGTAPRETPITIKPREVVGSFTVDGETEVIVPRTAMKTGYEKLQEAVEIGGDDFETGLQRAYLVGDANFAKSSIMNEAARNLKNGKDAFYQGVIVAKIKGETRNILKLNVDQFWDDMATTIRGQVDDYVAMVKMNPGAKSTMATLAKTTNGTDDVATYIALRRLKESGMDNAYKAIDDQIDNMKALGGLEGEDLKTLKKKAHELLNDTVDTELDSARNSAKTFNPDLVNSEDIYKEVNDLAKKIEGAEGQLKNNYVMYLNNNGQQVYAQVDPAFASLYNYRFKMVKSEASAMAKLNALTSRAFRYGTTSLNLQAFGNQMFRDFGNAILVGGAWQTIKSNADNLKDVFGERIVEQIKAFDPDGYEMKQISRIAEETGQNVNEAAVSRELMRGAAIAGTTTETSLYKNFMKQAYGDNADNLLNNAKNKLQELWEKYDPDQLMNGKRENYLRNRVYASSLNDAMKQGYSLSQSRVYAEFAMNNATTNFSRQLYHMQAIADSTPYFRAAINGTKSFWRMWSLDPVGVTGRIMGGMVLPVMFLTGASLGSEEDRKVYQNIPEYQKSDSLVFVFNGQAISIPLPQELSPIVAPFRQFVEYLHGANQNDFWELMMNDLLGFLPYDLTGFTAIDYDAMVDDPTFFDRTSRGVARLFSQMAPIPVKSAYMIASGTDPYTGKWLRDPSYTYWNDETGSLEVMDYYESTFASYIAKLFPGMNPAIADKVVSGAIGTTGSNLLGDICTFVNEGALAGLQGVGQHLFEQATNPVTVTQYDLTDAIWKRAVRQLTTEKESILSSDKMKTLNSQLSQTKDPEKRQKLLSERQDLVDDYQQKVANMVERLSTVYQGTFDRQKFAAVVALLNFNSDASYQSGSQYSSNIANEEYWNGRDQAIHTMERMGITGTSDMSIFGYLTTNSDGDAVMKYSSPVAIMDMENQWPNQDDINAANIKALLTTNNMYDAHKAVTEQINNIYNSKSKLTNQDYANIEAIQINWNAQLAKVIAPYVSKMTAEAAINNTEVMNLLYPYVEVPSSWETNDKGKYVSLGSKGNKKMAYYQSWIKSLFGVNDAYKGQY